jgi:hypothetical protein
VSRSEHRVFMSYRHQDSSGYAGWLYQLIAERMGMSKVFRDIDSIRPGLHFPTEIAQAVGSCSVALVLIGPNWLSAVDDEGRRRIDDPDDWVRLEIETALEKGLNVVPLLLQGAGMPPAELLPASIRGLSQVQAFPLRDDSFREDVKRVIELIEAPQERRREYFGSERRDYESRFAEMVRMYVERVEEGRRSIGLLSWRRGSALRPQMEAIVQNLAPDEDLVDVALASLAQENQSLTDPAWYFLGLLALTSRRLIHSPRSKPSHLTVANFRDMVEAKTRLGSMPTPLPMVGPTIELILRSGNLLFLNVKPASRAGSFVRYIKERKDLTS